MPSVIHPFATHYFCFGWRGLARIPMQCSDTALARFVGTVEEAHSRTPRYRQWGL